MGSLRGSLNRKPLSYDALQALSLDRRPGYLLAMERQPRTIQSLGAGRLDTAELAAVLGRDGPHFGDGDPRPVSQEGGQPFGKAVPRGGAALSRDHAQVEASIRSL